MLYCSICTLYFVCTVYKIVYLLINMIYFIEFVNKLIWNTSVPQYLFRHLQAYKL